MPAQLDYTAPSVRGPGGPYEHAVVATESDTVDLPFVSLAIWVGGNGNVTAITKGGETVTITGVTAGTLIPLRITRLLDTGTTATPIVIFG